MGRSCRTHGEMTSIYKILVGKPEGKRPLGSPRYRWEHNITMDRKEILWEGVQWIHLEFLDQLRDYHLLKKDSAR